MRFTFKATRAQIENYSHSPAVLKAIAVDASWLPDETAVWSDVEPSMIGSGVALTGVDWDADLVHLLSDDFTLTGLTGSVGSWLVYDDDSSDLVCGDTFAPQDLADEDLPVVLDDGALVEVSDDGADIDSLNARVTALEAAPSGSTAPGDWVDWTLAAPWGNLVDVFMAPYPKLGGRTSASEQIQVRGRIIATASDVAAALSGGAVSLGTGLAPVGQRPTDDVLLSAKVAIADGSFHTTSLSATVTLSASGEGSVDLGYYGPDGVTAFASFLTAASAAYVAINFGGTYSLT